MTAEVNLSDDFSGAPTMVHGGVILAVLDEAMAWACIAVARQWAVTAETTTRFERAVRVDTAYRVEARIAARADDAISTAAQVLDQRGRVRAEATARFTPLGEAQLLRAAGADQVTDAMRLDDPTRSA